MSVVEPTELAEVLGVPAALRPSVRRADALGPVRLAGTLTVGTRGFPVLDLAIDGMLGDSRLTGRALLESLRSPWREQRVDVTASLDGQELSTLLAQVLPETLAGAAEKSARTPARLCRTFVRADGGHDEGGDLVPTLSSPDGHVEEPDKGFKEQVI